MDLNQINSEIQSFEDVLFQEVDVNNGGNIAYKGQQLTAILPRLHSISAQLESNIACLTKKFVEENNLFVRPHTEQTRNILIEEHLSDIIQMYNTTKGYIKSIEETLDFYRTLLSFLKQEMSNLNIGK